MSAKAAVRHSGKVAIVDLAGRIALGEGSGSIRNAIKDLVEAGYRNILLNLQEVKYVDSSGLGEMVGAYATVSNMGGRIRLLNAPSQVEDLLRATRLYSVFIGFNDEAEAVRSFGSTAGA